MESVRIARWLLAPVPTFRLWRRMKLWELRSYDEVIKLEQDRLVYRARLRARYGRAWRRKTPVESLMPLRLARYGVPLTDTAPAGLAAAGLEANVVLPSALPAGTGAGASDTMQRGRTQYTECLEYPHPASSENGPRGRFRRALAMERRPISINLRCRMLTPLPSRRST